MKLLIILLNIVPIPIIGTKINTHGSFFPSLEGQKFLKYYLTNYKHGKIELLENIPIIPYTSISVIALDTKLLNEKHSELAELDEFVSKICLEIDWESYNPQSISSPRLKSKLSNQYKLATLFTADSHFEGVWSKWWYFMRDFKNGNAALNKLKEQLEIYIPKRSIKAYDIEFSNSEYYFEFRGSFVQSSTGPQEKTFRGWLDLCFFIPYSQEFFEDTKRSLLVALESLKNYPNQEAKKILKARIRDQDFNRTSYFEFMVKRPIEIEKTTDSSERSSYNITFEKINAFCTDQVNRNPCFSFTNYLFFEEKQSYKDKIYICFEILGPYCKHDMEEVNSILDEYFETTSSDTTTSRSDTTKSRYRKRTMVISLALFLFLAIAIFLLGYYYGKKVKNRSGRVYKKQQGRKKLKTSK